jgi:ATP-dependent Clp protease protease subunit
MAAAAEEKERAPGMDLIEGALRAQTAQILFEARRIFLFGEITQASARDTCERLVAMAAISGDPITILLNSQGGHVEAGDTIFDVIRFVKPRVRILGTGWVASAGAHIYLSIPLEDRFSLPNTRYMLHQPHGGVFGPAVDIGIEAREIVRMRQRLNRVIAEQTKQPLERVEKDTDRNFWMSAQEAKEYGIVGNIIRSESEL